MELVAQNKFISCLANDLLKLLNQIEKVKTDASKEAKELVLPVMSELLDAQLSVAVIVGDVVGAVLH